MMTHPTAAGWPQIRQQNSWYMRTRGQPCAYHRFSSSSMNNDPSKIRRIHLSTFFLLAARKKRKKNFVVSSTHKKNKKENRSSPEKPCSSSLVVVVIGTSKTRELPCFLHACGHDRLLHEHDPATNSIAKPAPDASLLVSLCTSFDFGVRG